MNIKRILFPTDFSPCADIALSHALFHAEIYGAELHIVHGVVHVAEEVPYFNVEPEIIEAKMEEVARTQLAEALQPHREKPFQILEENIRGQSAANIILDYAADRSCDMIVMGTHGRRFLSHFLLGSVAESVSRLAPCPVITVRAGESAHSNLKPIRHILVTLDFSPMSKKALQLAENIAKTHGAEKITLIHVLENYFYPGGVEPGIAAIMELLPRLTDQCRERLENYAAKMTKDNYGVFCEVPLGRPAHTIVKFAQNNDVDLIIAGAGGSGGLGHMLLGSTVERILRLSACPVFTFKPDSK